ncbi:MAG: hypothetical protein EB078_02615 [Proteobacteria bacterium]|nr:hypothetical protein [Pseudomonadota bacterium]NDC23633.1 hypothetical protein [Pseudomonadota bacterium]NDD03775.1 hypothetical protein [Pseudomonadota bacterium]NDG26136.1 hypothetical protein [Pseudomonadota bacterium]
MQNFFCGIFLGLLLVSSSASFSHAASTDAQVESEDAAPPSIDFGNPDTLIDPIEGSKNKHFVRRAILSSMAKNTSRFEFQRPYINHLMGFSAILQRTTFQKYVTGVQGLSVGYITESGHGFETGFELASISNIFAGYRYIYRPETFSLWPFAGAGLGTEVTGIRFSEPPNQNENYEGVRQMAFATLGFLVPLVDIGIKAEARFNFYGTDRLVLSTGLGVIFFL